MPVTLTMQAFTTVADPQGGYSREPAEIFAEEAFKGLISIGGLELPWALTLFGGLSDLPLWRISSFWGMSTCKAID